MYNMKRCNTMECLENTPFIIPFFSRSDKTLKKRLRALKLLLLKKRVSQITIAHDFALGEGLRRSNRLKTGESLPILVRSIPLAMQNLLGVDKEHRQYTS